MLPMKKILKKDVKRKSNINEDYKTVEPLAASGSFKNGPSLKNKPIIIKNKVS